MTPEAPSRFGNAQDWATIIAGAGEGTKGALQGASQYATSKIEAKEAKRRTIANLLAQAMKRNRNLSRVGQEYGGEMSDYQSQALQQIANGFVQARKGITG